MAADWKALEAEYVAGDMSVAELAAKHGISKSTMSKQAAKGKWAEKRKKFGASVVSKALGRASAREAKKLDKVLEAACVLEDKVLNILEDAEQFNRYICGNGENPALMKERKFKKADTRAMRDLAAVLKDLGQIKLSQLNYEREERLDRERRAKEKAEEAAAKGGIEVIFTGGEGEDWSE